MSQDARYPASKAILPVLAFLAALAFLGSCAPAAPVNLEIALFAGSNWGVPSGDSYRLYDEAIKRFEAENPDIKVRYRSGTLRDDYSEWLAQRIVRGNEPDLFVILPEDFNTYASIGVLEDLDSRIGQDPDFTRGSIFETALASGRYQDSQFALPIEIVPNLMLINTTLLEQAGVPKPQPGWTWADFKRICNQTTRDSDGDGQIDRFGATRISWRWFAAANGLSPFAPDGSEAYLDTPAFIRTIELLSSIRQLSDGQREPDFNSGAVAMTADQLSMYRAYKYWPYSVRRYTNFSWEAMEMPKGPDGRNSSELSTLLMALSHRSVHQAEAWRFLRFLATDTSFQRSILQYSHGWPAWRAAGQGPEVRAMLSRNLSGSVGSIDNTVINAIIDHSLATPRFRKYDAALDMADRELYQIIDNPYDLEDRLHRLNRKVNRFLQ